MEILLKMSTVIFLMVLYISENKQKIRLKGPKSFKVFGKPVTEVCEVIQVGFLS